MLTVFETILEMSLTASIVILVVMLARMLLSKAPKKYAYLLWLVVAFRLCVPFSFESSISIFNTNAIPTFDIEESTQETSSETVSESVSAPEVSDEISVPSAPVTPNEGTTSVPSGSENRPVTPPSVEQKPEVSHPTPEVSVPAPEVSSPTVEKSMSPEVSAPTVETPVVPPVETPVQTPAPSIDWQYTLGVILATVWAIGVVCMLGYGAVTYIKLKKRLQTAVLLYDNVYGSDRIGSPFALGIFGPRIYIPFGMGEESTSYILAHERYHLKRLDHLVKPLSFLILCVHWFNPLCWLAFNRMSLDMELSCDERVLKQFGDENMKKKYSKTLLDFATDNRYPTPAPISFSEGAGAKTRIKHALYWKKPRFWVSAIALLLCAVVLVACAANAVSNDPSDNSEDTNSDRIIDFGDTPYLFTFESNGDGTCVITDIKTDFNHTEPFDLVIPEKSPDGDKVVEVDMSVLDKYSSLNVPTVLSRESFESIIDRIENSDSDREREAKAFKSFYNLHFKEVNENVKEGEYTYVVLEKHITTEEYNRLSSYLADFINYTAEDCYADTLKALALNWTEQDAVEIKQIACSFFYHDASNIKKVILPNKEIMVRQSEINLTFAISNGTEFIPAYKNPVSVSYATEEQIENTDQYSWFIDNNAATGNDMYETIAVTTTETITDFCFFALSGTESYEIDSIFFTRRILEPTQTFMLDTVIPENIPRRGIGFMSVDGRMHYYAICWSGYDSSLHLQDITAEIDSRLILTIRHWEGTDESDTDVLRFESPGLLAPYELLIKTNRFLSDLTICKIEAKDYSEEKGWLYTATPFDAHFSEFTPKTPLLLTAIPSSIVDTYGISFTDQDGQSRTFAIFESEIDRTLQLIDISNQIKHAAGEPTTFKVNDTLPFYEATVTLNDEGLATSLSIRDTKTGMFLQTIAIENDEYCNSSKRPIAADLNFDHNLDILILYQTTNRADYYHAFVYNETSGEFVHAPSFMYVPNYKLDTANNRILGYSQGDMRVNYEVVEYDENAKDFVFTNSLYYEHIIDDADGDTIHFVEYEMSEIVAEYTMQGNGNYYRLDENDDRMKPYLEEGSFWELNSNKWRSLPYDDAETVIATYPLANGTLYHVRSQNAGSEQLFIQDADGSRKTLCILPAIPYSGVSPDGKKIIWNYWMWNATIYFYDAETDNYIEIPISDLGDDYTVSSMEWLDNRYFMFVAQFHHDAAVHGGDIFVYDTQKDTYGPLIKAGSDKANSIIISSITVNAQTVDYDIYNYVYDEDKYIASTHTFTKEELYNLIESNTHAIIEPNGNKEEENMPPVPSGETLLESFQLQNGYLYHTQDSTSFIHILRIMHYNGTTTEIHKENYITNIRLSPQKDMLIWNDFAGEFKATVWSYDIKHDDFSVVPISNLGEDYTPSYMDWYDNRYFLFVSQLDHGSIVRGGDVYIYDTRYSSYGCIIDAQDRLMITSFETTATGGILLYAMNYNETDDTYTEMTYEMTYETVSVLLEDAYGVITLRAEDCREVVAPLACPVEVVPTDKEPSIKFDSHAQEVFEFTFTKDVKGFAIVKIDTGVAYDVTIDPLSKQNDYKAGDTLVCSMYINDIGDSRGFVLIGEDGKLHYYALRGPDMAGFSSDYSVVEVTDHPLLTVDGKTPDFNP